MIYSIANTCSWLQGPDHGFDTELEESDDDNPQDDDENGLSGNDDDNELSDNEEEDEEDSAAQRRKIYKTGMKKTCLTTKAAVNVHRAACEQAAAVGMRKHLTEVSCSRHLHIMIYSLLFWLLDCSEKH